MQKNTSSIQYWPINIQMETSFIYLIESDQGHVKIGYSQDPESRLSQLQTAHSKPLVLKYTREIDQAATATMERIIHEQLKQYRMSGEWFDISADIARSEIDFAFITYGDIPNLKMRAKNKTLY